MFKLYFWILFVSLISTLQGESLLTIDFEANDLGPYTASSMDAWGQVEWEELQNRAVIVEDEDALHHKALRVSYPAGAVGPREGGAQFNVMLEPSRELWLSYDVKFGEQFDFRLGGKLPGLTSGGSRYTGGRLPTEGEGWSARFMWREHGEAIVYLYYVDMPGIWGEDLSLSETSFRPGKWHRIVQHIRVNDEGESNGVLDVWLDGEQVLERNDLRYRLDQRGLINSIYFSTFHGGNTAEWGPKVDCYAYFDQFVVSTSPLIESEVE